MLLRIKIFKFPQFIPIVVGWWSSLWMCIGVGVKDTVVEGMCRPERPMTDHLMCILLVYPLPSLVSLR